jgi:hypothetical protein
MKHRKKGEARHVRLYHYMTESPAWNNLGAVARAIYCEISKRYNGTNNGFIVYSIRQAADELKIGTSTAKSACIREQSPARV